MPTGTPFAACVAALALAACGSGATPSGRPTPPATTPAPGTPTARTACDLISLHEAASVLHVAAVREPNRTDRAHCNWVPVEQSAATAYFSVTLDVNADVFDDERANASREPGYHELGGIGDAAYFYAGALRVKKGDVSFVVMATSDVDRDLQFSHVETHTQVEYQRIVTEAARLVATRV